MSLGRRGPVVEQAVAADDAAAQAAGVTSRDRLGGGLAAERQTVRRTSATSVTEREMAGHHCPRSRQTPSGAAAWEGAGP